MNPQRGSEIKCHKIMILKQFYNVATCVDFWDDKNWKIGTENFKSTLTPIKTNISPYKNGISMYKHVQDGIWCLWWFPGFYSIFTTFYYDLRSYISEFVNFQNIYFKAPLIYALLRYTADPRSTALHCRSTIHLTTLPIHALLRYTADSRSVVPDCRSSLHYAFDRLWIMSLYCSNK